MFYGEEGSCNWCTKSHIYSCIIAAGAGGGLEIIIVQSCTEVTAVVRLDKASETVQKPKKVEASDGSDRQVFGAGLDSFCLNYDGGGGGWYFGVISSNTCGAGVSGYVYCSSQFSVMY